MHPFFEVLRLTLLTGAAAEGRILFRVLGVEEQRIAVDLEQRTIAEAPSDIDADLTVFCDRVQLDAMLESGFAGRALRCAGDRSLLDRLAASISTAKNPISIRGADH